jgi:hypothetical protein
MNQPDDRGDSPCPCPVNSWGRPDCQESNPPDTYCKWERQCEERAAEDREPPDPDGECFRGRESASALAEEQARVQRELKR